MGSNAIMFSWNRSIPGREAISAAHFQDYVQYLTGLQERGAIQSFEVVFLDPHGGNLNGFVLIRGETEQLDALVSSSEWIVHQTRAMLHLEDPANIRALTGAAVMERMEIWTQHIPSL